jgi:hypothetical protein
MLAAHGAPCSFVEMESRSVALGRGASPLAFAVSFLFDSFNVGQG